MEIIAALTKDQVIGDKNSLLWKIPDDLKGFKALTSGNVVIMGRKTYESIGRPLPNRTNIVISRNMPKTEGIEICNNVDEAVVRAKAEGTRAFVIGGEQIYTQMLPLCDKMHLSWVKGEYEGDAHFPKFNADEWKEISRVEHPEFTYIEYTRILPLKKT